MITLIAALYLLTTVKSGVSGFEVKTVRSGDNVTIKCDQTADKDSKNQNLAWYKQTLGNVPEHVVRLFAEGKPRFALAFENDHFTLEEKAFDLSITGIKEENAGAYFCGKVKGNVVEFVSGTLLVFEAEKMTEMLIQTGESVTLQCSVQSLTSNCSEEHGVYWFRPGSGESHPGIIYTHGNRSDECKKSSETDSSTQSCVYKLPKRNLSLTDAGTYYCAVAACEQILFGNRTKVNVQENTSWIVTLIISNVMSIIVIMVLIGVLLKSKQNGAANNDPGHTTQAKNSAVLNYAALKFVKKPPSSGPQNENQDQT